LEAKMDGILQVKNLSLIKDKKEIIKNFNLSAERYSISAVIGINGAGKSSLAYVLMGLKGYKPDSGAIYFNSKNITEFSITDRAQLGMTLAWQNPSLFEGLTVKDYIQVAVKNKSLNIVKDSLYRVALDPSIYLHRIVDKSLSGGERKRIELAAVFAMRPKLAILDEPDSGIDAISLDKIIHLIKDFKKVGSTVLLITHRDKVAEIADRAFLICNGEIIKEGPTKEISLFFKEQCNECTHKNIPISEIVREGNA